MSASRTLRAIMLIAGALAGLACGDLGRPTSPSYSPKLLPPTLTIRSAFASLPVGTRALAVKWGSGHSRLAQTVSAVIGPDGGTLSLPESDFSVSFPSGAVASPTLITIVSEGGPYVAYQMQPHGLRFLRPVTAVQGLQNTAVYGTDAGNSIRSAYLPAGSEAIYVDDTAEPSELQAATTYFYGRDPVAETQVWTINHFSRYILISNVWVLVSE